MWRFGAILGALLAAASGARADQAGEFDYYVAALSWNANWCAAEGDSSDAPQCDPREEIGFVLHGLWPQNEDGWPEYCSTRARDPSRSLTNSMADLYGSRGLAWHQWKKHGRCSGLEARDYFALAREAWARIARPAALRRLDREVRIAPEVIEDAFLEANPRFDADGVTVTCRDGAFREVRICFTRDLEPRPCARDARRDCSAATVSFSPMR